MQQSQQSTNVNLYAIYRSANSNTTFAVHSLDAKFNSLGIVKDNLDLYSAQEIVEALNKYEEDVEDVESAINVV